MDINTLLNSNDFEISELLRQNQILAPGLNGIKEGYDKYGDAFVMKVVGILKGTNSFSNFSPVETVDGIFIGDTQVTGSSIDSSVPLNGNSGSTTGSGSNIFNSIISAIGTVGSTVNALTGKSTTTATSVSTTLPTAQSKMMLYLAGAAILIIVFFLFIKKSK